ncbi:axoneme-associated protein mst101(2)-like [Pectinophora gossypiella]|uniref:axoneme-associated protein mst101(2)-like n=1 Tax=Pectinophora gossypiella TaxID=13191 RepID=UPI00214EC7E9|nr:axoneme-associated protein mst101(2)-like [Pectinophora gossypiella]
MKSKSFDLKKSPAEKGKPNKTFDFVNLYKSTAETNVILLGKPKTVENLDRENSINSQTETDAGKRERSPNKKKKKGRIDSLNITHVNIDGHNLNTSGRTSPATDSRATSTPYANRKTNSTTPKVKSIMKNSVINSEDGMDGSHVETPVSKPKKRNKSVSFMLEDSEETATKKTKSDDSLKVEKKNKIAKVKPGTDIEKKKLKKMKKHLQAEKENKTNVNMETDQNTEVPEKKSKAKFDRSRSFTDGTGDSASDGQPVAAEKKKKLKKIKKRKKAEDSSEPTENDSNNNEDVSSPDKPRQLKTKNRVKPAQTEESVEGEPATKLKKEVKPEVIAEDLENLSIGDNAHTLTNLLDEMTVVDKNKKKKNKLRRKKDKKPASVSSSETADLEKIEEGKEKVKWKKRKWNKDKKGDVDDGALATSVIIDNLPLKIMCSYKNLLADHFGKLGLIKKIGIAEVYPTEEPKPVFTTTIMFYSDGAAAKALEEDNTTFEGSRIRVKRPLPPTQTTLVVRSYGELNEQSLSSVFTGAGRIRNIRHLAKGKKSMATAFIEFDGPEAVERALKLAVDAKIGGKKIHVSKFELRGPKKEKKSTGNPESENEGDSENSND